MVLLELIIDCMFGVFFLVFLWNCHVSNRYRGAGQGLLYTAAVHSFARAYNSSISS